MLIPQWLRADTVSWWRVTTGKWWFRDICTLGVLVLLTLGVAFLPERVPASLQWQLQQMLTLLAMAGVAAAVILVSFAARIDRDVTALRISSGLIVYGGVVLPLSAVGMDRTLGPVGGLSEVMCFAAVVLLLALGPVRRGEPTMAWPAAAVAIALSLCVAATVALLPALLPSSAVLSAAWSVVLAGGVATVAALVGTGIRRRSVLLRQTGLGLGVIMFTHVAQFTATLPATLSVTFPAAHSASAVSGLRAVGVAVVLAGAIPYLTAALRRQRTHDDETTARLQAAEQAGQAAEWAAAKRAHEIRNLVTGLSGAAYLLAESGGELAALPDRRELATALRTELERLSRMLEGGSSVEQPPAAEGFELSSVVATVVAVHRAAGARIDVELSPELRAAGSPEAFAQVMRNLLVNCTRHAPGAPVHVQGGQAGGRILLRVADEGSEAPRAATASTTSRSPASSRSSGSSRSGLGYQRRPTGDSGLGLNISTALMREHGGSLRVLPSAPGMGFVVELELKLPATGSAVAPGSAPRQLPFRLIRSGTRARSRTAVSVTLRRAPG